MDCFFKKAFYKIKLHTMNYRHLVLSSILFFKDFIRLSDKEVQLKTPIAACTASFSSADRGCLLTRLNKISIALLSFIKLLHLAIISQDNNSTTRYYPYAIFCKILPIL